MDETTRGHTTTFTRAARARRMLDCLSEGWSYRDVASVEGLSERRVRQIVAGHVRRSAPVDEDAHAALQIERLGFAVKVAGEALAKGDIRAIAPYIKAIDRLDAYQTRARKATPSQPSREPDALVVKALVDRVRRVVEAEAARSAGLNPVAAAEPALVAEPSPPPIEPESQPAAEPPPLAAAEPAPPLAKPDRLLAAEKPPALLAEPSPPLAGPDGPLDHAPPPVPLAEPRPPLAGSESPLDIAVSTAVAPRLAPPAPAPVAPPFAGPNLSNIAMSNFSPFFWR